MKITFEFDDDEIDMLSHIPECPCMKHCQKEKPSTLCKDCYDGFLYSEQMQKYKDKGIYEVAMELQKMKENARKIMECEEKIKSFKNENEKIKQKYSDIFKTA